jgi:dephospho-CoA kinase
MLIVGITGGIGSGKTAVTDEFERLGISVVDADVAARTVVEKGKPALEQIAQHFGSDILLENEELNRAALRKLIFDQPNERKWLEQLTHPLIRNEIIQGLQSAKSPYVILASPLLIESGQYHLVKRTLVVDVPESLQIERTCKRDNNDAQQVQAIINAQLPREKRLKHADDVICNNKDLAYLHAEVAKYHQQYLELTQS